ncbi:MAG: hypothetical protein M3367_19545 [Acidobacteriota bacterium]|nr:hypothetical protein [Acidobacteriota bacterium]
MKKLFIITTFVFAFGMIFQTAIGQETSGGKVANYAAGKMGQSNYEHFSFWTNEGKRSKITYAYGKNGKGYELEFLEAKTIQGREGFEVKFPNNLILFVIPTGNNLRVINPRGSYNKIFKWKNGSSADGSDEPCSACVENETEAMILIKNGFLN